MHSEVAISLYLYFAEILCCGQDAQAHRDRGLDELDLRPEVEPDIVQRELLAGAIFALAPQMIASSSPQHVRSATGSSVSSSVNRARFTTPIACLAVRPRGSLGMILPNIEGAGVVLLEVPECVLDEAQHLVLGPEAN